MSFGQGIFLGNTPTEPITGAYPGVTLNPTELSGVVVDIREINGFVWIVRNAYFDLGALQWVQANPSLASSAVVQGPGGATYIYTAPAFSSPFAWTLIGGTT